MPILEESHSSKQIYLKGYIQFEKQGCFKFSKVQYVYQIYNKIEYKWETRSVPHRNLYLMHSTVVH